MRVSAIAIVVYMCACTTTGMGMMEPGGPDAGSGGKQDGFPDAMGSADAMVMPPDAPSAQDLLARIASCDQVIGGTFADDSGGTSYREICGLPMAMFWKADMDIDCDGQPSGECNSMTDPSWQGDTAAHDSQGNPLDSASLPYVVVPGISSRFDYSAAGLELGTVIAVIHQGKLEYGVFGDIGPRAIIGEASYAMAQAVGVDPDPATGGVDDGVSYIAFVGAVADPIEDHTKAVMLGIEHAKALLATH